MKTPPGAHSATVPVAGSKADASGSVSANEDFGYELPPGEDPENRLLSPFAKHLVDDQKHFWMMPRKFQVKDLKWAAPAAGMMAAVVASDSWIEKQVPSRFVYHSQEVSNYAVYSLVGLGASSFLWGRMQGDDHLAETGMLSAEAAVNSTAVSYLFKSAFERQRPGQGSQHGTFLGGGSSFPSEHAAVAWSIASVWAHEYPSALSQTFAYGLASAVTLTRVTGRQHFASDVLVGSALGWYFGRRAYRAHHDTNLGGAPWGNPLDDSLTETSHSPRNMGSPYVPIDSWVYPSFDRLIVLGYVTDAYLGLRPWTRMECTRLLQEAEERRNNLEAGDGDKIFSALAGEFHDEARRLEGESSSAASLDSIYLRTTSISGVPLRDGYHFGQTIINDQGRPFAAGFNAISGVTAHAQAGPMSFSLQGEYQHAPGAGSDPLSVLQATAAADGTLPLANATTAINRFQLLTATASLTFNGIQFSFGRQSLWLGPGESGPFLYSSNAAPMTMLRIDSVSPYEVPLLSRFLGPVRSEFFLGRLSGQTWEYSPQLFGPNLSSQPFVHGTKFSFHPTPNLEFGMGFTAQFGGTGNPFTWANFLRTFYSHRAGIARNPAKRLSEFDLAYRVPGLRNWMQVYLDSMVIDEYSPIGSTRPAINPGVYFPRLPKLHNLEVRLEGVTTDLNIPARYAPGAFYWDTRYRSGYTNDGNLIGNWSGRSGRGEQGWITYHFSPRSDLQLAYRQNSVDRSFLNGGWLQDLALRANAMLTKGFSFSSSLQYESWHFPLLLPAAQSNLTASFQLNFCPNHIKK
ncbi:MAG TPA: capsule assembly Wzi family protein [Candidatus Acidoferrum sp.]|nr:capsule assembly Wzi family protein [Candidatus Acidoferrum sp.]